MNKIILFQVLSFLTRKRSKHLQRHLVETYLINGDNWNIKRKVKYAGDYRTPLKFLLNFVLNGHQIRKVNRFLWPIRN